MTPPNAPQSAFRQLPFMGVIRVNVEAMKVGYRMGDPAWSNLGQGQPEVGDIAGAPPRFDTFRIDPADHAYGPVEGVPELRQAVADHYNRLYRRDKPSQYTADNVAVAAGGRLALSRIGASMENVRLGYFTPDYTAYEDLLTTFHRLNPTWIELRHETGFRIAPKALEDRIASDGIGALLISNPCNPTGVVISGTDLAAWVDIARRRSCTLLMDEFYSHYVYGRAGTSKGSGPVSAAAYVEDVDRDPVVIIDGLTKCFRYPGWRLGWVVAPKPIIQALTAAGSFLDGGPSRPMQRAAIEVLQPERADQETAAVRAVFAEKRRVTVARLQEMGIQIAGLSPDAALNGEGQGTFYVFASVRDLPAPLNDGQGFMREAFKHRVLTVPGEYFDVNPHKKRTGASPLSSFVRFSFGPPRANLEAGLGRLADMVRAAKR
jgi:aspartate/methionine/tyrosine aminotransferase